MFAQEPTPDFDISCRREPGELPELVAEVGLIEVACATGEVGPVDRSGGVDREHGGCEAVGAGQPFRRDADELLEPLCLGSRTPRRATVPWPSSSCARDSITGSSGNASSTRRGPPGVSHPNTVTVYEFGEFEGRPFIATECAAGESLAKLIRRGPLLSLAQKPEAMGGLCSGLRTRIVPASSTPTSSLRRQDRT